MSKRYFLSKGKTVLVAVLLSGALFGASAAKPSPAHAFVIVPFMAGYKVAKLLGADALGSWIGEKVADILH